MTYEHAKTPPKLNPSISSSVRSMQLHPKHQPKTPRLPIQPPCSPRPRIPPRRPRTPPQANTPLRSLAPLLQNPTPPTEDVDPPGPLPALRQDGSAGQQWADVSRVCQCCSGESVEDVRV